MQTPTHPSTTIIYDLLFADNCGLNSTTEDGMRRSTHHFVAGCSHSGLTIYKDKTVVIHQPSPNSQHNSTPLIHVDGSQLKTVDNFAYLESTISSSTSIHNEANRVIIAKGKREAGNSLAPRLLNANSQLLPACSHCQRTLHVRIGHVAHLRTQSTSIPTASTSPSTPSPAASPASTVTPVADDYTATTPSSSITDIIRPALTPTSAAETSPANTTRSHTPPTGKTSSDIPSSATVTISTFTSNDVDSVPA
nr:unnamed protein product [Spirometra erinaceieuropaei]